jgi:hypothetical protein
MLKRGNEVRWEDGVNRKLTGEAIKIVVDRDD